MYKAILTGILILLAMFEGRSQVYERIPADEVRFRSLEQAMKDPLAVRCLDLSRQRIREFPPEILEMKNLRYLVLSRNRLQQLPDSISLLSQLEYLDLSGNRLLSLPEGLGRISSLRTILLRRNPIFELPASTCDLLLLNTLDIWGTQVSYLPPCIYNLSASLNTLNMRHTPMSRTEQQRIFDALPETRIYYTTGCKCDE